MNAPHPGEGLLPVTTALECLVHPSHTPRPHINEIHHIWPLGKGGPDVPGNKVVVCATGHNNIHDLLRQFEVHHGEVPYAVLRRYAHEERRLAQLGYERSQRQAL
jgi:hypothetical protein